MAKTTAIASGVNRFFAAPVRETPPAQTRCRCQRRNERRHRNLLRAVQNRAVHLFALRQVAMDVLHLDRRIVHQDADRQRKAAQRHGVERLPKNFSTMIEVRIESGIEIATTSVLRQLPRKSKIISAVRLAAITASRTTPCNRGPHEDRLVEQQRRYSAPSAEPAAILGSCVSDPLHDVERGGRGRS